MLAHSSNIGAIQIGLKVGDRDLYKYVRKFGFGRKTGIELPGESAGLLRRVENWTPTSIGSVAMGHEVGVTSLQLALAGAAIANGGMLVKPQHGAGAAEAGRAGGALRAEKPVADHRAGDRHPDAPDDGRRGAARHRTGTRT